MIAKVAHSYAVAERAFENNFTPILPDFILGKVICHPDYLVGCIEENLPAEPDCLHRIYLEHAHFGDGKAVALVVNVRLFAAFGAPQYHVVVGLPTSLDASANMISARGEASTVSTQLRK
jgi:hypothetical protein